MPESQETGLGRNDQGEDPGRAAGPVPACLGHWVQEVMLGSPFPGSSKVTLSNQEWLSRLKVWERCHVQ